MSSDPLVTQQLEEKKPLVNLLGIPFDATSSYRPGSRFGPNSVRETFRNIEIYSPNLRVDLESESILDLGNIVHTASMEYMIESAKKVISEIIDSGETPAVLGGEHSVTYPSYLSTPEDTVLIVFDAHLDLRDEFDNLRLSHATFLRRLTEKRRHASIVHIGARAASAEEWKLVQKIDLDCLTDKDLHSPNSQEKFVDMLRKSNKYYVSVDTDILDPAYAPGVGNPEAAGLSTRELIRYLDLLKGKRIIGFDIVELCPPYDNGSTASAVARILVELVSLVKIGKKM